MKILALALPASISLLNAQQPDINKLIAAKDWTGLEAHARARIAAKPRDGMAHNLLGIALGNQGRANEARAAFRAAVGVDGRLVQAWYNLILADAAEGDGPALRKDFAELRKTSPAIAAKAADEKTVFEALADPPVPTLEWSPEGKGVLKTPSFPPYPPMAGGDGIQGEVVLEILVDAAGVPTKARMLGGPLQLGAPSESLAMKWRFAPRLAAGTAVPSRAKLALVYKLDASLSKLGAGPDLAAASQHLQDVLRGSIPR